MQSITSPQGPRILDLIAFRVRTQEAEGDVIPPSANEDCSAVQRRPSPVSRVKQVEMRACGSILTRTHV